MNNFEFYGPMILSLILLSLAPSLILVILSWAFLFLWSHWKKRAVSYKPLRNAFLATLATQVGFAIIGGIAIGKLFGLSLSYATPAVVMVLTQIVGVLFFFLFLIRFKALRPNEAQDAL